MKNREVANAIMAGKRILFMCFNAESRMAAMRYFCKLEPRFAKVGNTVCDLESKGYAHFVLGDRDVIGQEYDLSAGGLSEYMQTRIRPAPEPR